MFINSMRVFQTHITNRTDGGEDRVDLTMILDYPVLRKDLSLAGILAFMTS